MKARVQLRSTGARARRGEVRVQLTGSKPVREVEDPARAREFGHPDAVEHHHVEPGIAPFQVDHEELPLLVAAPGQALGLDADAGVRRFELFEERRHGIDRAQELRVLEDHGDGARRRPPIGAAREGQDETETRGEKRQPSEAGDAADPMPTPVRGGDWHSS